MSEKQYVNITDDTIIETSKLISMLEKKIVEQQATIDKLDQENADLLGARIKAQEEWEKCTDKLKEKILEQQATIERLTKRRDRWRELSNSFSAYCNCYEKAIERAFEEKPSPSEEDINRIYAELEKELENE